ncbi:L-tyrosine/L-tryptophan isonitrile synthase family protein [Kitasatospora sp. NPDC093550]|uniref:L-tyrosine/L-tryptophan isonitrile synthase family protein n=1 Tax=Kitasatospora sp. NPDC093550 TaxID=3364089 RepID=UPI0038134F51
MPPAGTATAPNPATRTNASSSTSTATGTPSTTAGSTDHAERLAARILGLLLPHRRASDPELNARSEHFPLQLSQLADFIAADEPIVFTLPGFPCKSPNPAKVLGHLPDEGERLSLTFLDRLCAEIGRHHAPGARILICSDGHVFGDLIDVPDEHIDAYSDELTAMIARERLGHLATFDLRAVLGDLPYDEKRARVHERYAPSVEELREQVLSEEETLRLYRGITRFLTEDAVDFPGTRSALQRECRRRAYGVIQRSRAWGELIAEQHPRAVRLSIHPQPAGVAKFGIRLLAAADVWTTPWHSSVLHRTDGSWELLRSEEAAELGRPVLRDGRPSHYEAC